MVVVVVVAANRPSNLLSVSIRDCAIARAGKRGRMRSCAGVVVAQAAARLPRAGA